jgi:hypothetical protein
MQGLQSLTGKALTAAKKNIQKAVNMRSVRVWVWSIRWVWHSVWSIRWVWHCVWFIGLVFCHWVGVA